MLIEQGNPYEDLHYWAGICDRCLLRTIVARDPFCESISYFYVALFVSSRSLLDGLLVSCSIFLTFWLLVFCCLVAGYMFTHSFIDLGIVVG